MIPKIVWCDELPQWIIESATGAYHPVSQTIYIRKSMGPMKAIGTLLHELSHHAVHVLRLPEGLHEWLDRPRTADLALRVSQLEQEVVSLSVAVVALEGEESS